MKRMKQVIFSSLMVAMVSAICMGELYQWTDDEGIRHFSNVTPPVTAVTHKTIKESTTPPRSGGNTPKGPLFRVMVVYDGDSIKVQGTHRASEKGSGLTFMVRLVGIDAPETGYKKRPDQPLSQKSKQMLANLVAGKQVSLKSYGIDTYNRQLAEVFADGINVNLALLAAGMAEIYRGSPVRGLDLDRYKSAQASAKRAYRGIWGLGGSYQSPKSWRKQHPRKK